MYIYRKFKKAKRVALFYKIFHYRKKNVRVVPYYPWAGDVDIRFACFQDGWVIEWDEANPKSITITKAKCQM